MQLTNTTDYAIRIVCYLAIKKHRVTTAKLASELKIPESYIPKITKQLKKEKIISASEGISGGYTLAKNPEKIRSQEHAIFKYVFQFLCLIFRIFLPVLLLLHE